MITIKPMIITVNADLRKINCFQNPFYSVFTKHRNFPEINVIMKTNRMTIISHLKQVLRTPISETSGIFIKISDTRPTPNLMKQNKGSVIFNLKRLLTSYV